MIKSFFKKNMIKFGEIYYTDSICLDKKCDILKCYQVSFNNKYLNDFFTIVLDLKKAEIELFEDCHKNTRYEINRNRNKDEVEYFHIENPTLEVIEEFMEEFKKFVKFKKLNVNLLSLQESLIRNKKNLLISYVLKEKQKLVWHVYFCDQIRARLKCSISIRNEKIKNLIGRSNRGLHWSDILFFKDKNYFIYDLGGIDLSSSDADKKNIKDFKGCFGGRIIKEYEGNIPVTLKGKLIVVMYNFFKKVKNG